MSRILLKHKCSTHIDKQDDRECFHDFRFGLEKPVRIRPYDIKAISDTKEKTFNFSGRTITDGYCINQINHNCLFSGTLRCGDIIIEINGQSVKGIKESIVHELLNKLKEKNVTITLLIQCHSSHCCNCAACKFPFYFCHHLEEKLKENVNNLSQDEIKDAVMVIHDITKKFYMYMGHKQRVRCQLYIDYMSESYLS